MTTATRPLPPHGSYARANGIPAAADNAEGMRLDWADECELLWSAPFDPQTGLELLRRDIRKQQKEEGK